MGSKGRKKWTKPEQPSGLLGQYQAPDGLGKVPTKSEQIKIHEDVATKKLNQASQPVRFVTIKDHKNVSIKDYKGVYNSSIRKVVSVVSETYTLLPNKSVIDPVLNFLEKEKIKYIFDRFSYVTDRRMRIHFTFPDFKIKDDTDEGIMSSIFMHNSYDMMESHRFNIGAMRQICSNGMTVERIIKRTKFVHRSADLEEKAVANVVSILKGFDKNKMLVEQYIQQLIETKVTVKFLAGIATKMEAKIFAHLMKTIGLCDADEGNRTIVRDVKDMDGDQVIHQSMWQVYNILTQYISHITFQRYRLDYLRRVSKMFGF